MFFAHVVEYGELYVNFYV